MGLLGMLKGFMGVMVHNILWHIVPGPDRVPHDGRICGNGDQCRCLLETTGGCYFCGPWNGMDTLKGIGDESSKIHPELKVSFSKGRDSLARVC